jgi:hypothetical protein
MLFLLLIAIIFIIFLCSKSSFFKALLKVVWIVLSFIASVFIFLKSEESCSKGWFNDCSAPVHLVALIPITGVTLYILYLLKSKLT